MVQVLFLIINLIAFGLLLSWLRKFWHVLTEKFGILPVVVVVIALFSFFDFRFAKSTEKEWNSGQKVGKMKTFTVDSSLLGSRKLLVFQDANDSTAVARIVYVETGLSAFKALHVEEVDYFPASRKAHFRTREDWYVLGIKIFTHGKTYNYPLS